MTEEELPGELGQQIIASAGEPMNHADFALLASVQQMYDELDPMPTDLVERVQFALALDEVFDEVAHLTRLPMDALAVRGDSSVTGTRTETLTFSAERLTAMITVTRSGNGRLRIDGWIAPPAALEVRLRMQGERRSVVADASGRFVMEELTEGFAQLSFHATESGSDGDADPGNDDSVIVTPLFQL